MKLNIKSLIPGTADGIYEVTAGANLVVSLYWADTRGILEDWTAFGMLLTNEAGYGSFEYIGQRAVPREATHIAARCRMKDGQENGRTVEAKAELKAGMKDGRIEERKTEAEEPLVLAIMSDLHLSQKTGTIKRVFQKIQDADALLLVGDLVNDGLPEQFQRLRECMEAQIPEMPVFSVTGNHDYPLAPLPLLADGINDYCSFQEYLREKACRQGQVWEQSDSGAYAVRLGKIDLIGLNAVSHWRRFVFRQGRQLEWLCRHLEAEADADWHVIFCHAPMSAWHPLRDQKKKVPYLSRDEELQRILDDHRNLIFVSGHTHISMQDREGCVYRDPENGNLYLNDGSIRPTMLRPAEQLQEKAWTDGDYVELRLTRRTAEVTARSLHGGQKLAGGYYWFCKER